MNTVVIEVVIGMVLIYAVLSLFVTVMQELALNTVGRLRGRHLALSVSSAFGENAQLTNAFFASPLIMSLSKSDGGRKPSYVPPDIFAKAFLSVLGNGRHPADAQMTPAGFLAAMGQRSMPSAAQAGSGGHDFVAALTAATRDKTADWATFEGGIATWFYEIGERSRGWFKRESQWWGLGIALAFTVLINADSIMIARSLMSDAELRKGLADAAVVINAAVQPEAASAPRFTTLAPARELEEQLKDIAKQLVEFTGGLRADAFLQAKDAGAVTCRTAPPSTVLLGTRCMLNDSVKLKGNKEHRPVHEWVDDAFLLRDQLRPLQAADGRLDRKTGSDILKRAAETLEQIAREMQFVEHRLVDANSRRTINDLTHQAETLSREVRAAMPPPQSARAALECRFRFPDEADQRRRCETAAESPLFELPLGYGPDVVAKQLGTERLKACEQRRCEFGMLGAIWAVFVDGALPGWLLTMLALSLGAPFWFDMLGKLVKVRASGTPEETKDKPKAEAAEKQEATMPGAGLPATGGPGSGTTDLASDFEARLSDDEKRALQRRLMVTETGVLDTPTRNAIAARRKQLGVSEGSSLDASVFEAIMGRTTVLSQNRPTLQTGSSDPLVADLRTRLVAVLGIPPRAQGSGTNFGDELRAAVRLFQGRCTLPVDGVVGPQTWARLDAGDDTVGVAADAWMKLAIADLGLDERVPADQPSIIRYFSVPLHGAAAAPTNPQATAWCAYFVAFQLRAAGKTIAIPTRNALAKSWIGYGNTITEDTYGAVTVLESRDSRKTQHHVGFMVGRAPGGWVILGGNQSDGTRVSVVFFDETGWEVKHRGMP